MTAAQGWALFDTALGACGICWGAQALCGVQLPEPGPQGSRLRMQRRFPGVAELAPPPWVASVQARVQALLDGGADSLLDVPLDMAGVPPFHQRVYAVARAITPGRTMTYGEVAAALGDSGAARAVGQALGHNPFAPIVPCHRVLAAGTRGGGFSAAGGVDTQLRMLLMEGARFGREPGLFDKPG